MRGVRRLVTPWRAMLAVVFVVALAARTGMLLRHGGYQGIVGYDCGVYFAGSDALLHGRLPYKDFVLVHPPGITIFLLPFAWLTRFMTDWHAFTIANFAFCALGSVNAVLVTVLARRLGVAKVGAALAGLFYAGWFASVLAEFQIKLEPLGNFLLLLGLLVLHRAVTRPTGRNTLMAGVLLGLTVTVKIWWCVPLLVIVLWFVLQRRDLRAVLRLLSGMALSVLVVIGPFVALAPHRFFELVVMDQMGRARSYSTQVRLANMTTFPMLFDNLSDTWIVSLAVALVVVIVGLCVVAWRFVPAMRMFAALTLVQLALLIEAPSWFPYYGDYLAVSLAMVTGAVGALGMRAVRVPARTVVAWVIGLAILITASGTMAIKSYAGAAELTKKASSYECVMTNNPTFQIRLNALTRGLEAGCPNLVDVGAGVTGLASDAYGNTSKATANFLEYVGTGDAAILFEMGQGYLKPTISQLDDYGVIADVHDHVLYRTS